MSHEYVYKISSRYLQKWLRYDIKLIKNRHFSPHFGTLPWFSEFYFLTDFDASRSVLGSFFTFFPKIWLKNMYRGSKSRFCLLLDLFYLVTWDDLDMYYGHKAQEMILTDVSDTIHADSLVHWSLVRFIGDLRGAFPPPPAGRVSNQTPAGRRLTGMTDSLKASFTMDVKRAASSAVLTWNDSPSDSFRLWTTRFSFFFLCPGSHQTPLKCLGQF